MKTTFPLPSFVAFAIGALAQPVPAAASLPSPSFAASNVAWSVTPAVVSEYMFRGVRLGGAAFQPTIELAAGNLALGIWGSFPLADKSPRQSDPEIDLFGSYTVPLSPAASLTAGFTFYTYPRAERNLGFYRWTFEPSLAVNYTLAGVRFTPRLYFDTVLEGPTAELTAAYALPLATLGTELDLSATIGTYLWRDAVENHPERVKNSGDFWLAQVEIPFQVAADSKLILGFAYTRGSHNFIKEGARPKTVNPDAVGRGVVTAKYSFTF